VRELKRNVAPAEPGPRESRPARKDHSNDTSKQPEHRQEQNYSQTENHLVLAAAPAGPSVFDRSNLDRSNFDRSNFDRSNLDPSNPDLPVVSVTTYRRFV